MSSEFVSVCNQGRKVLLDLFDKFGEKAILSGSENVRDYIKGLEEDTRRCFVQYLVREQLEKRIKGKPMMSALYKIITKEFPLDVLRYVKLLEFERKLEVGEQERERD